MELNHKQVRFGFEYAKDGHGTNAAIRAGYAEKGASQKASELLGNEKVQEIIERQKLAYATLAATSFAEIILELKELYSADRTQVVKLCIDPCLNCYSSETRQTLKDAGMSHTIDVPNPDCKLCMGRGVDRVQLAATDKLPKNIRKIILGYKQGKEGVEVKLLNPLEPLMHMAKMLGFNPDRKELSGPGGGPMQIQTTEKPLTLWTREEISARLQQIRLQNSVMGVLEGVLDNPNTTTIEAKRLTD